MTTLNELKVGDNVVVCRSGASKVKFWEGSVVKVTKTQIKVTWGDFTANFLKRDGHKVGSGSYFGKSTYLPIHDYSTRDLMTWEEAEKRMQEKEDREQQKELLKATAKETEQAYWDAVHRANNDVDKLNELKALLEKF